MNNYKVIGLMSGSSLDGLDIVYSEIRVENKKWNYRIFHAETIPYPDDWKLRLQQLPLQDSITYLKTDVDYGHYLGGLVIHFIAKYNLQGKIDFIASHGHTIIHQPENKMTCQIGDGAALAAEIGLPVVCNFRTMDVAHGGQGAPIVPIGDILFFGGYSFCLNLGGISNISYKVNDQKIIAYDICICNSILNFLAQELNAEYDEGGKHARSGNLNQELLSELNASPYYKKDYPKTLGWEFVNRAILPLVNKYNISVADKLRTYSEHIAIQTGNEIRKIYKKEGKTKNDKDAMLVTGGGAFNTFLVERITENSRVKVFLPDEETIKFKEALIMGLMGVLRWRNEINCLSSVTGASKDNCGGEIFFAE